MTNEMICQPLRSLEEIQKFVLEPPPWQNLCRPLTPHSTELIRNMDTVKANEGFQSLSLERPETFCHFDIDKDFVKRYDEQELPRTMVCHDIANSYNDDAVIDGTGNDENYVFYNWAGIDIFCYYGRNLVTVPPVGWINVGHAHGVKVIGTIVTEWTEGTLFWDELLNSPEETEKLISHLVSISKILQFEGWLLNIENKISRPKLLVEFVRNLHAALHDKVPNALLIWYDCVTDDGHLSWQNGLNEKNKVFFDACDGIFTNYSWTTSDVEGSMKNAGARHRDVFIGVDVWGRNFYGGGMFNTQEAVRFLYEKECSLGVFAPAWTFEDLYERANVESDLEVILHNKLSIYQLFLLRDRALWNSLWPFLNTRVPSTLPFKTSFCRGRGKKRLLYGEVLCNTTWYNLRHMQYQPNSAHGPHGYLLSTVERIQLASANAMKDKKGIMKLRHSLVNLELSNEPITVSTQTIDSDLKVKTSSAKKLSLTESSKAKHDSLTSRKCMTRIDKLKHGLKTMFHVTKKEEKCQQSGQQSEQQASTSFKLAPIEETPNVLEEETDSAISQRINTRKNVVNDPEKSDLRLSRISFRQSTGKSMLEIPVYIKLHHEKVRFTVVYVAEERECLAEYEDDAFLGGSCLVIYPSDSITKEYRTVRILHCDFQIEHSLVVCMATKHMIGFHSQYMKLVLQVTDEKGPHQLVLVGRLKYECDEESTVLPLVPGTHDFCALKTYLMLNMPEFYIPIENSFGWIIFYYEIVWPNLRVTSINARTGEPVGPILLGYLGVCSRSETDVNDVTHKSQVNDSTSINTKVETDVTDVRHKSQVNDSTSINTEVKTDVTDVSHKSQVNDSRV